MVTNSFHGTIFSILFEKPFVPVFATKNGRIVLEERKYSILNSLGLISVIHTETSDIDLKQIESIDYDSVSSKLNKLREIATKYIESALK